MHDPVYNELQSCCMQMKAVNDTAERGINLIQKYNETLTKDEDQKQFIV